VRPGWLDSSDSILRGNHEGHHYHDTKPRVLIRDRLHPLCRGARTVGASGRHNRAEERIAATLGQARKDAFRVARAQQALFAFVDTLAKALLACVPEPPAEARPQAIARANERYDRLIKSAGRAMAAESGLAMKDLVNGLESDDLLRQ